MKTSNGVRRPIYLDHAATTPVAPAVLAAMQPYFSELYGNPSSMHQRGRRDNVALEQARRQIAEPIGALPKEVIFTSGGTEGDNAAIRGIALARRAATGANRIVTTPIEHHAVLHTALDLRDHFGFTLTLAPVNQEGLVTVAALDTALGNGHDVAVASVMYANNEIGTIQPIADLGALCQERRVPLHTDAVQAAGNLALDVKQLGVAALTASAHKFYGPKGVGFFYLRNGTPYLPFLTGGSHEGNRRAGTENVPLIVGMATAFALAEAEREVERIRLRQLRDHLIGGVLDGVEDVYLTGAQTARLDHLASFILPGVAAEELLIALDLAGIAASSGSACASGSQRPSHVLEAIGIAPDDTRCALRFSLGRSNTAEEIDYVVEKLPQLVKQLKGI
ncbi:MAG: cysteine desulfurase family protein [Caldilineaceae bacterium]